MSAPVVMPKLLSLQAPPAQSAEGSVTVTAPSDAQVTASITGGDSLLTIESVTAVIYVWRDANPHNLTLAANLIRFHAWLPRPHRLSLVSSLHRNRSDLIVADRGRSPEDVCREN